MVIKFLAMLLALNLTFYPLPVTHILMVTWTDTSLNATKHLQMETVSMWPHAKLASHRQDFHTFHATHTYYVALKKLCVHCCSKNYWYSLVVTETMCCTQLPCGASSTAFETVTRGVDGVEAHWLGNRNMTNVVLITLSHQPVPGEEDSLSVW